MTEIMVKTDGISSLLIENNFPHDKGHVELAFQPPGSSSVINLGTLNFNLRLSFAIG